MRYAKIATIMKGTQEDGEQHFVTVESKNHTLDTTEWCSGESFEEVVIDAFSRFDTSDGVFPVLRRSNSNSEVWVVTNSLNAAVLDL